MKADIVIRNAQESIIRSGLRNMRGRMAKYEPTKEGFERFRQKTQEYFEEILTVNETAAEQGQKIMLPDVSGWAAYLGVSRTSIFRYTERGGIWEEFIENVRTIIAAAKMNAADNFQMPPMLAVFSLTNDHKFFNTSEFRMTDAALEATEAIRLEDALTDAGLVWNEAAGEYLPILEGDTYVDGKTD